MEQEEEAISQRFDKSTFLLTCTCAGGGEATIKTDEMMKTRDEERATW